MATVINNPAQSSSDTGSGIGMIVGIILLLLAAAAFFVYSLPYIRNAGSESGSDINAEVPRDVNVNVNPQP